MIIALSLRLKVAYPELLGYPGSVIRNYIDFFEFESGREAEDTGDDIGNDLKAALRAWKS